MYLSRKLTTRSLPEIGRRFGGRDHTTVLHACRRIEALCRNDTDVPAGGGFPEADAVQARRASEAHCEQAAEQHLAAYFSCPESRKSCRHFVRLQRCSLCPPVLI